MGETSENGAEEREVWDAARTSGDGQGGGWRAVPERVRQNQACDEVRGLGSGALDLRDRSDEADGQDDDFDSGVSGDAEGAVRVVFAGQVGVRHLHSRAEKQQQDAQQAGEARIASTKAA